MNDRERRARIDSRRRKDINEMIKSGLHLEGFTTEGKPGTRQYGETTAMYSYKGRKDMFLVNHSNYNPGYSGESTEAKVYKRRKNAETAYRTPYFM